MTYSTRPAGPTSLSIGLMDPSAFGPYSTTPDSRGSRPKLSYKSGSIKVFASGTAQNSKTAPSGGTSKTAVRRRPAA